MITVCSKCGAGIEGKPGKVLPTTMTEAEEASHAAAFRCTNCNHRMLETWPEAILNVVERVQKRVAR